MKTDYDIEIEEKVKSLQVSVKIHRENDFCFEKLEQNYPIGLNRIDWEEVDDKLFKLVEDQNKQGELFSQFLSEVETKYPKIKDGELIVFGDDSINQAYQMSYETFKKMSMEFISLPQHTYILVSSNKCLNYTFEDEMYFG